MRAVVVSGPGRAAVEEVEPPRPGSGEVVIDIARVGLCGTDFEFFRGDMAYLHQGHASYPIRLGHEWCGTVSALGDGVDRAWLGRRTTGDTMLPCHRCARCRDGRGHLCDDRQEVGVRRGRAGALAEQLAMPVTALHPLPDTVDVVTGALVEPGANALRAVWGAGLKPGQRVLILGAGAIGLLAAMFLVADGVEVHVVGRSARSIEFARGLGLAGVWSRHDLPPRPFDAVIDASNDPALPALTLELIEPGRRVVYIGLAGEPSPIDSRDLVIQEVTAVGVLSGYGGIEGTLAYYARGAVDPRPLVAATVPLEGVAGVLAGERPAGAGPGPKFHVDPRT